LFIISVDVVVTGFPFLFFNPVSIVQLFLFALYVAVAPVPLIPVVASNATFVCVTKSVALFACCSSVPLPPIADAITGCEPGTFVSISKSLLAASYLASEPSIPPVTVAVVFALSQKLSTLFCCSLVLPSPNTSDAFTSSTPGIPVSTLKSFVPGIYVTAPPVASAICVAALSLATKSLIFSTLDNATPPWGKFPPLTITAGCCPGCCDVNPNLISDPSVAL
jgi:hypothetical protein